MDAGAGNHPSMDAAAARARREAEPRPPEPSYQRATASPRAAADGLGPSCLGLQVACCTFTHCRTAPHPPPQPTLGAQLPLMHPGCEGDGSVGAHGCQAAPGWGQETAPASGPLSGLLSGLPASSLSTTCSHSCSWDTSPAGHHLSHLSWAAALGEALQ